MKVKKILILALKIFLIGLLLQFFLQTFVTFKLGWNNTFWKIIWSWKEIFIVLGFGFLIYFFVREIKFERLKESVGNRLKELKLDKMPINKFIIVFVITAVLTLLVSLVITKVGIGNYILSAKYDLLGFFIFILSFLFSRLFFEDRDIKIVDRYSKILKWILIGALFWWMMVYLMPNFLKFFGYNQFNFEGTIGSAPPAAYYTEINQGAVRNQFLFERPIGFGFFLIAFWPLFYFVVLKGKSKKKALPWILFYGLIVFSTISRAALGVWVVQTLMIFLLMYRGQTKRILWKILVPAIVVMIIGGTYFFKTAASRIASNIGHIQSPLEGIKIIAQNPIFGWGAGYAGPASHQICYNNLEDYRCQKIKEINTKYEISTFGFNPENQYIQILMEYGIVGFIGWILMYFWLHLIGYKAWLDERSKKVTKEIRKHGWIIVGFSLGLLGLSLEGFVLHSFVDRMIVYPFMALFGLVYALYWKERSNISL